VPRTKNQCEYRGRRDRGGTEEKHRQYVMHREKLDVACSDREAFAFDVA
jgi:hypothetical protein